MTSDWPTGTCLECGEEEAKHKDPKTPPLDTNPCLCNGCFMAHCDEVIEELEDDLEHIREMRAEVG